MNKVPFKLGNLDHVAIRVSDSIASIAWYEKVVGLKAYRAKKWGDYPIFLLSGKTGIALFPETTEEPEISTIDHIAFNVSNEAFKQAKAHYDDLNLDYRVKDHYYFHSIYTEDPDGHTIELTTLVVPEASFYGSNNE